MKVELIPFKKVGIFSFGEDVSLYKNNFRFISYEMDESGWESFEYVEYGITLHTEEQIIVSISCIKECFLSGVNLIGMTLNEFINHTRENYVGEVDKVWMNDEEEQFVYEFENIGLQVWANTDEIIITIIASPFISDDED